MYDLLILGALLTGEKSGYKLQTILGTSLKPIRKVSNGVLNPVLHKLEQAGLIATTVENVGRKTKHYHLTDAGRLRFFELMKEPVTYDAKREDRIHFKLKMLESVNVADQIAILEQYRNFTLKDIESVTKVLEDKQQRIDNEQLSPELRERFKSVTANFDLDLRLFSVTLAWIDEQIANIKNQ